MQINSEIIICGTTLYIIYLKAQYITSTIEYLNTKLNFIRIFRLILLILKFKNLDGCCIIFLMQNKIAKLRQS